MAQKDIEKLNLKPAEGKEREGKKRFFWEISPKCGWVGWLILKQGPPQITPKIAFFDPNFTFCSPKSHKNTGVGGWVTVFGEISQKNFPKF